MISELNLYKKATNSSADTEDIIRALLLASPGATKQIKGIVGKIINVSGDPVIDAGRIARWVNKNITYQKDDLQEQKIRFPSNLLNEKKGDCKSFSLLVSAVLTALGYKNGFRFAAYRRPDFTHVYNFVVDNKGKKHTFDACIPSLKESPTATKLRDMYVSYVAQPDQYLDGPRRDRRRANRADRKAGKKAGKGKKISLALPRQAFLGLVKINFRNLAVKQALVLSKNPEDLKMFWLKLGGDFNKLKQAIEIGRKKKPVLGKKGMNGVYEISAPDGAAPAETKNVSETIQKFLPFVGPILTAIANLFKKNKVDDAGVVEPEEREALGDFEASDPETQEAANVTKQTPAAAGGFDIQSLLLPGAALAALFFLSK